MTKQQSERRWADRHPRLMFSIVVCTSLMIMFAFAIFPWPILNIFGNMFGHYDGAEHWFFIALSLSSSTSLAIAFSKSKTRSIIVLTHLLICCPIYYLLGMYLVNLFELLNPFGIVI